VATVVIYVGEGDPKRSMELLWGKPPEPGSGRGPKAALSVDAIVEAAIAVADEGGMDAVSMRAVGERLHCTSMALYTYVPGKAELVELMWDRAQGSLPAAYDASDGWRPALTAWALANWNFAQQHPWTLHISGARPTLGPHETRNVEAAAATLAGAGLTGRDHARVVWSLARYVHGSARALMETRAATDATGVDENQWWFARSAMLEELAPNYAQQFPALTLIGAAGGFEQLGDSESYLEAEARDTFEFGLARLLDGIESLVQTTGRG
jgi:AcrR family transcriptional regulator